MVAFFRTILGLLVTIPVAAFCGLNTQAVDIIYSPFHDPISLPLYAIVLGFALLGGLFGAFSTWLNNAPLRKQRRLFAKRAKVLEKKLKQVHEQTSVPEAAAVPVKVEEGVPATTSQDE